MTDDTTEPDQDNTPVLPTAVTPIPQSAHQGCTPDTCTTIAALEEA